jgi:hypothetical protein
MLTPTSARSAAQHARLRKPCANPRTAAVGALTGMQVDAAPQGD